MITEKSSNINFAEEIQKKVLEIAYNSGTHIILGFIFSTIQIPNPWSIFMYFFQLLCVIYVLMGYFSMLLNIKPIFHVKLKCEHGNKVYLRDT